MKIIESIISAIKILELLVDSVHETTTHSRNEGMMLNNSQRYIEWMSHKYHEVRTIKLIKNKKDVKTHIPKEYMRIARIKIGNN